MERLNVLTGLRGVAAYSLLIAHAIHYSFIYPGNTLLANLMFGLGHFGMSLTFVISGFVIHYNYAHILQSEGMMSGGYRFMVTRVAKLYPLYIFCLVMSLGSLPSTHFDNGWQVISALTLTQTWFNLEGVSGGMFGQAWPISAEWFFYLVFLLFSWSLVTIKNPLRTLIIFLTLTPICLAMLFNLQVRIVNFLTPLIAWKGLPLSAPVWYWLTYFCPFLRLLEFIAGVLASQVYLANIKNRIHFSDVVIKICLGICVAWCVIAIIMHAFVTNIVADFFPNFIFAPAIAPMLILLCRYHTSLSKLLCKRFLMFIGEISYSVWVFQFAIMSIFVSSFVSTDLTWMSPINATLKTVLIVILSTVFGYGSYLLLEVPAQRWLKSKLNV